jgi:ribonuclease HI
LAPKLEAVPPEPDVLKVNIDGAFTPGHGHAGWGVVVRDHRGEVVAATAGRTEHVSDAFHAELHAAVQALRLVEHLGAIRIILESDFYKCLELSTS